MAKTGKICRLLKKEPTSLQISVHRYFYHAPQTYDEKGVKKSWKKKETPASWKNSSAYWKEVSEFTSPNTEEAVKEWVAGKVGFGKIMNPFRLAIVC